MTHFQFNKQNLEIVLMECNIAWHPQKFYGPAKPSFAVAAKMHPKRGVYRSDGSDFRTHQPSMFSHEWAAQRSDFMAQQSAFRRARGLND